MVKNKKIIWKGLLRTKRMAKLRGKHKIVENEQSNMLKYFNETFPNDAPYHIVIITDKEYKEREE